MFCYCFVFLNSIYFLAEKRLILELCHRVDGDKVSWVPTTKKVFAIFLKTISSTTKKVFAILFNTIFSTTKKYFSNIFLHNHQECISSNLKNDFFNTSTIFFCSGVLASCCLWSHGSSWQRCLKSHWSRWESSTWSSAFVSSWSSLVSYPAIWSFPFILGPLHWSSIFPTSREHRNKVQLCTRSSLLLPTPSSDHHHRKILVRSYSFFRISMGSYSVFRITNCSWLSWLAWRRDLFFGKSNSGSADDGK